jgi:hypothetical protein
MNRRHPESIHGEKVYAKVSDISDEVGAAYRYPVCDVLACFDLALHGEKVYANVSDIPDEVFHRHSHLTLRTLPSIPEP